MNKKLRANISHPGILLNIFLRRYFSNWMSDETWLKLCFRYKLGYKLNLKDPQTFSEKLQWLKLYNRRPEYTKMVDKAAVKEYVASIIGPDYIIPTLGKWGRAEDIEWEMLPDRFVLKCNHDSGSICICRNKDTFNCEEAAKKLAHYLTVDYYKKTSKEWPYKNVKPCIIAEPYMDPSPDPELLDYKFFCFNGEPKLCQVIGGRNSTEVIDFFDKDWNHQPFHEPKIFPFAEVMPQKPKCYNQMWGMARQLAADIPFVRIDFYEVNGHVYFGEITFFPTGGFGGFDPFEWDYTFGSWIKLPNVKFI